MRIRHGTLWLASALASALLLLALPTHGAVLGSSFSGGGLYTNAVDATLLDDGPGAFGFANEHSLGDGTRLRFDSPFGDEFQAALTPPPQLAATGRLNWPLTLPGQRIPPWFWRAR